MSECSIIGALRHRIRGWETRRDTGEELRVTILRQWESPSPSLSFHRSQIVDSAIRSSVL